MVRCINVLVTSKKGQPLADNQHSTSTLKQAKQKIKEEPRSTDTTGTKHCREYPITNVSPVVVEFHGTSLQFPTNQNKLDLFGEFVCMSFKIYACHQDYPCRPPWC